MQEVVIVSAVRTPVGRFQGSLQPFSATQLGALVVREAVLAAQPGQTRRPYDPGSALSKGQSLVIQTDADRRGVLMLFNDHIEYRDEGMGTNGGRAPYGPNPANDFSLSCAEIEKLKSYGFRAIVFGSFQVVITANRKNFHIPALHGDSVVKAIREKCGISN